jgi:hypothetical protein
MERSHFSEGDNHSVGQAAPPPPDFRGTRGFIIIFSLHAVLTHMNAVFNLTPSFFKVHFMLSPSRHLLIIGCLFAFCILTKTRYEFIIAPMHAPCDDCLVLRDLSTLIMFMRSTKHESFHCVIFFHLCVTSVVVKPYSL